MLDLLKTVRVLDVSSIVMGPMAGQILGDLGADVTKLEPPQGDLARYSGSQGPERIGALFANNNRNKRSIVADLKTPEGQAVLTALLDRSDVVLHNMRPSAAKRVGLDPSTACSGRPSLIYCAATGFGTNGPYAERPAYDDVIQAVGGLAGLPTSFGKEPSYVPSIAADKIGALHIVYSILAALYARSTTGCGQAIEVPMFECLVSFLMNEHLDAASFEAAGKPGYSRLLNPWRRPYATSDGWLAVLPYDERQWRAVLGEIGELALADETWFVDPSERNARSALLYQRLAQALPSRTTAEWIAVLIDLDIPHGRVSSLDELLDDPHLKATNFFSPCDGMNGRVRSVPQPVIFSGEVKRHDIAAPKLGADTNCILAELGLPPRESGQDSNTE